MAITLGAILALLSVAVAVYPFLQRRFFGPSANETPEASGEAGGGETPEPSDGLASIYDAIRTLQLERELGNIPEGLYREQLNGYRMQAALVLRERDGLRTRPCRNPSLPDPSLPDPSLPDPSLPDPSLPDPSLPDPSLPDSSLPDSSLEEEIKLARAGLYSPGGGFSCSNCARPIPAGNDNCPECGVAIPKQTGHSPP